MPIDFVITWVDPADKSWQDEKSKYETISEADDKRDIRFRDWECLKYLFRGIEKNAPWVRKVFFITCGQQPAWLNIKHKKLVCLSHSDFIPEKYLPTFNSNAIQVNLHRIKALSEQFVLFDDDMFILNKIKPTDFFINKRICTSAVMRPFQPYGYSLKDNFSHLIQNNISIINKYFDKRQSMIKNISKWINVKYGKQMINNIFMLPWKHFSGFTDEHLPNSVRKSVIRKMWQLEKEAMDATSRSRFRNNYTNINHWLFSYWDMAAGYFYPRDINFGRYYEYGRDSGEIYDAIKCGRPKLVCLNDDGEGYDFNTEKKKTIRFFERLFPKRSSFEI